MLRTKLLSTTSVRAPHALDCRCLSLPWCPAEAVRRKQLALPRRQRMDPPAASASASAVKHIEPGASEPGKETLHEAVSEELTTLTDRTGEQGQQKKHLVSHTHLSDTHLYTNAVMCVALSSVAANVQAVTPYMPSEVREEYLGSHKAGETELLPFAAGAPSQRAVWQCGQLGRGQGPPPVTQALPSCKAVPAAPLLALLQVKVCCNGQTHTRTLRQAKVEERTDASDLLLVASTVNSRFKVCRASALHCLTLVVQRGRPGGQPG